MKRYNSQDPTGKKVDGYDFKFSDEYFLETKDGSVPLEGVTVGRDGKTLKIPKVEAGRYVVCIIAEAKNERIGMFYAPINVVNKDADTITDNAAAGTTDGSGNDSKSDEDSAKTGDDDAAAGTTDSNGNDSKSEKDSAKTGDDNNLALWLVLMLLAGAGTAGTAVYTRRKRTTE